jgi:hypothetical protein
MLAARQVQFSAFLRSSATSAFKQFLNRSQLPESW